MAWLYDRTGVHYVGWRDESGRVHGRSSRTRNRRVAEASFRKFRREMAEASPAASQALPETVADAVEAYLDAALSRMRPATYRAVESAGVLSRPCSRICLTRPV